MKKLITKQGFTLIEMILYVAALGILVTALSSLTLSTIKSYRLAKVRENLTTSADAVFSTFLQEARNASQIYAPTSVLDSDNGELSLVTGFAPTNKTEPATYVDIYLAGGRVWLKRENETATALTDQNAEVTQFKVVEVKPNNLTGLRLYLSLRDRINPSEKVSLTTFAMPKGNYIQ
ncbi:MAG: type II secretion system protein [Minisyncoccia bacterium]